MNQVNAAIPNQQTPQTPPPPPPKVPPPPMRTPAKPSATVNTVEQMVKDAFAHKCSDIHIRVGHVPRFRVRGELLPAGDHPKTTPEIFEQYLSEILTPLQRKTFAETKELDTAIFYPGLVRCRVNCFDTLTGGAIVLRLITLQIPSIDELKLPQVLKKMILAHQGLILVTGPTGSGKSTTMAAMMRYLNENETKHVVTIEDPIEYVHLSQKCLISQREVGLHTHDFYTALRAVLREDPDVILIGEMRDRITIGTALQAAQTGHLVLGTLHTRSAINTLNRLLNMYPPEEQEPMRVQILESLVGVVAQLLLPTTDGKRTAVHDILINTAAMKDYLMKGNEDEAFRLMATDTIEGMQIMNVALYEQVINGRITIEDALGVSPDINDLERRMRTGGYDSTKSPRDWA